MFFVDILLGYQLHEEGVAQGCFPLKEDLSIAAIQTEKKESGQIRCDWRHRDCQLGPAGDSRFISQNVPQGWVRLGFDAW